MKLIDKLNELFQLAEKEDIEYAHPSDLIHGEVDSSFFESHGIATEIVQEVGGEGQGETYYAVVKFSTPEETTYIRFDAWYASYNGAEYGDHWEVAPEQETTTVYKPI